MNNLSNEVRDLLIKHLKIDLKTIPSSIDTETIENWDSLAHLMIIEEISKKYNLDISTSDASNLLSEQEIIQYLKKNLQY